MAIAFVLRACFEVRAASINAGVTRSDRFSEIIFLTNNFSALAPRGCGISRNLSDSLRSKWILKILRNTQRAQSAAAFIKNVAAVAVSDGMRFFPAIADLDSSLLTVAMTNSF